jgi:carboxymethylenebutenolidase
VAALIEGPDEVEVERIVLPGPAGPVDAIHARPLGMPVAGVVVHPDILGIRPLFDDLARRLATHGFAVCAPEPFWAVDAASRAELDAPTRLGLVADLGDARQLGVLEAAADHLVVADDVQRVAIIGFCMGGMYALKAAGSGRFDRAVSCYGMVRVPEGWRGDDLAEPLDALADACPVLAVFGGVDPWTPSADVEALRGALAAVPGSEVVVYPEADHGFVHDPDRPAHRAEDAADVWSRVLAFLSA